MLARDCGVIQCEKPPAHHLNSVILSFNLWACPYFVKICVRNINVCKEDKFSGILNVMMALTNNWCTLNSNHDFVPCSSKIWSLNLSPEIMFLQASSWQIQLDVPRSSLVLSKYTALCFLCFYRPCSGRPCLQKHGDIFEKKQKHGDSSIALYGYTISVM
jgi:hypothetical protein